MSKLTDRQGAYEVRAKHNPNLLMATGFYGEAGRAKAQRMIDERYWEPYLVADLKGTEFIVVERAK